jgi:hypothetical protein
MKRRDFFRTAGTAVAVTALARSALALAASGADADSVPPLSPPASGVIQVACATSRGTTDIDYVGSEAVFETWYTDPVTKKPAPNLHRGRIVGSGRWPHSGLHLRLGAVPNLVVVPAQRSSPALLE